MLQFLVGESGIPLMVVSAELPDQPLNLRITEEESVVLVVGGQDVMSCTGFEPELLSILRGADEIPVAELPTPDAVVERVSKVAYMMA